MGVQAPEQTLGSSEAPGSAARRFLRVTEPPGLALAACLLPALHLEVCRRLPACNCGRLLLNFLNLGALHQSGLSKGKLLRRQHNLGALDRSDALPRGVKGCWLCGTTKQDLDLHNKNPKTHASRRRTPSPAWEGARGNASKGGSEVADVCAATFQLSAA